MVSDVEEQVCFSTKNITDTCLGNLCIVHAIPDAIRVPHIADIVA